MRQTDRQTEKEERARRHLLHSTDKILGGLADLLPQQQAFHSRGEEGGARSWVPIHFHCVAGLHRAAPSGV